MHNNKLQKFLAHIHSHHYFSFSLFLQFCTVFHAFFSCCSFLLPAAFPRLALHKIILVIPHEDLKLFPQNSVALIVGGRTYNVLFSFSLILIIRFRVLRVRIYRCLTSPEVLSFVSFAFNNYFSTCFSCWCPDGCYETYKTCRAVTF